MPLHIEHRPSDLTEVFGNKALVESLQTIFSRSKDFPHAILLHGPTGCVDKDTEFLSPRGWVKISDYKEGMEVMQYNSDGTSEFVIPLEYIKEKEETLYLMKTHRGINQCVCTNHRMVYFLKDRKTIFESPFSEMKSKHELSKRGFSGSFKTVFSPKIKTTYPLSDAELRVQVMVIADANITNRKKCGLNLKRQRKIKRAEFLLQQANIPYDKYFKENGYVSINFVPPLRVKEFISGFYLCSLHQLEVIADEVLQWDGTVKYQQFSSTSKQSIDFIQYVFASIGKRASIYTHDRQHTLSITDRTFVGVCCGDPENKMEIKEYKTLDGYKYCFRVPSTYLILRREGNIFITGNCGKTTIARIIGKMLNCAEIQEYNMANTRGIDTIREIDEECRYRPFIGDVKVYIFDEVHRQTKDAQNSLLKLLEDPPEHVFIILCTTEPEQLIPTLRGRCHTYQVKTLDKIDMMALLKSILVKEKIQDYPVKILNEIILMAEGHPRNALVMLDSVIDMLDEATAIAALSTVSLIESNTKEICQALLYGNRTFDDIKDNLKQALTEVEPEKIRQGIMGYMTNTILGDKTPIKTRQRAVYIIDIFSENIFYNGRPGIVKMICGVLDKSR